MLVILNNRHQKISIILRLLLLHIIGITHPNSGAFIQKCVVNYELTAVICKIITLVIARYRDISDNQDNFLVDIEISFVLLSHIPTFYITCTCTSYIVGNIQCM